MRNRIKSGIYLLSLVVMSPVTWAQDSVTFIPSWKVGDHYEYVLSRVRQDYTYDTLYSTTNFEYNISLAVSKETETVKEITLVYKGKSKDHKVFKKTPDKFVIANALEYLTVKLYGFNTLKVVYTTDISGALLEIKNKKELRNYVASVINAAQHEQAVTPDFKGVLEQFKPTLLSDDYLVYSFLPEISFYHSLYGTSWKMGKQKEEVGIPNPITGESLPGILTTEVKKTPAKKIGGKLEGPFYEVQMLQKVDQEQLSKSLGDKTGSTFEHIGKEDSGTPPIDLSVTYRYTVKKELIKKASYSKTVVSAESKSVEEFVIR